MSIASIAARLTSPPPAPAGFTVAPIADHPRVVAARAAVTRAAAALDQAATEASRAAGELAKVEATAGAESLAGRGAAAEASLTRATIAARLANLARAEADRRHSAALQALTEAEAAARSEQATAAQRHLDGLLRAFTDAYQASVIAADAYRLAIVQTAEAVGAGAVESLHPPVWLNEPNLMAWQAQASMTGGASR